MPTTLESVTHSDTRSKMMRLTYYGHACFGLHTGGKDLLFDPFITPNPLAKDIDISAIPADYVLLTHGHVDHVADAAAIAKHRNATIISNYEIVSWFQEQQGIEKGHPLNHGGKMKFDFGTVKYVNAVHSSVLPDGSYGGNPGGFIIDSEDGVMYNAGDTALTMDMQLIPMSYELGFAILPIGDNFTMGIDDAVMAADFIKCKKIVGMHYNTFPPIAIDTEEAKEKFKAAGCELLLPAIGETIEL